MMAADRNFFEWVAYFIQKYWSMFLFGTGNTLLISLTGTILGFIIGLAIGVFRTIPLDPKDSFVKKVFQKLVSFLLVAYIEIFRGTPMMVQAMVIFYGIPIAFPSVHLPVIFAGILIISINTGAYLAEIVRGGILAIDKGQFEAAHTLGMTHTQTMMNIILPQAIRNIMPALGNEFVINIKDSSVLNVIGVSELFFEAKGVAGSSFRFFEVFFVASVIYFVCTFSVTRILRYIEKKLDGPENFTIHGSQTVPEAELKVRRGGKPDGNHY
jgi:putative lysine transport system permease protein